MKRKRMAYFMIGFIVLLSSCSKGIEEEVPDLSIEENYLEVERNADLIIGYQGYPSGLVQTYLAKTLLEDKGYSVDIKKVSRESLVDAFEKGVIDVTFGCWLPDLDKGIIHQDHIIDLGINYPWSSVDLYVPSYAHIASTGELNFYKQPLHQKIYVLNKNKVIHEALTKWLEEKGYTYELVDIETDAMDQMIQEAIENKQWFIFAGWSPHYLLGKYDLRALEGDSVLSAYPQEMHTLIRKDYAREDIEAHLRGLYVETWEMNELMYLLRESEVENYPEVINEWSKDNYFTLLE